MCLLIGIRGLWPERNILELGAQQNKDGIGVAYSYNDTVYFEKDIKFERLVELKKLGMTKGIVHFRLASIGDPTPQLCHPFPVSTDTSLDLSGTATSVLAHNGHWNDWRDIMLKNSGHARIPTGQWSDTRAMAWLAAVHGLGFLQVLNEKVIVLTKNKMYRYGRGWEDFVAKDKNDKGGYWLSYDPEKRTYNKSKNTTTVSTWESGYDKAYRGCGSPSYGSKWENPNREWSVKECKWVTKTPINDNVITLPTKADIALIESANAEEVITKQEEIAKAQVEAEEYVKQHYVSMGME